MRILAYGVAINALDEYMGKNTTMESLKQFVKAMQ
jgi:hypothetical protein